MEALAEVFEFVISPLILFSVCVLYWNILRVFGLARCALRLNY